jgi:hypothetical protein
MEPRLKQFLQGLLHQAIHSGIFAAMWKMPLSKLLIVLGLLIAIAVAFGLY